VRERERNEREESGKGRNEEREEGRPLFSLSPVSFLFQFPSVRPSVSFPFPSLPSGLWPFLPEGLSVSIRSEPRNEQERTAGNKERNEATGDEGNDLGTKRKGGEGRGPCLIRYLTATGGYYSPFRTLTILGGLLFPISFIGGQGGFPFLPAVVPCRVPFVR